MKLRQFIEMLNKMDEDAVVVLADWSEGYELPSEYAAEFVKEMVRVYKTRHDTRMVKKVIVIGEH